MKIALVTGAGRQAGLGFETSRQLAQRGFHVVLTARKYEQASVLANILREEKLSVSPLEIDTTDASSVSKAVKHITEHYRQLDVLINNAAIMAVTPVTGIKSDLETASRQFETNLLGSWRMSQEFYELLKASGNARVVNVSSGAGAFWDPDYGLVNNPGFEMSQFGDVPIGTYALSKLALNGLTIKLSQDFRDANILVNSVCPGLVATYPGSPGRPVEEGAKSIMWAATLPDNGPTGLFFRDGKQLPW